MATHEPIEPWVYMDHIGKIKKAVSENDTETIKTSAEKCRTLEERVDRQGRGFQIPENLRAEFRQLIEKI